MFTIPGEMVAVIARFAPVFRQHRVWLTAQTLVWGAILAQGRRTVCAALRAVGLSAETRFTTYHRVLNRARWSAVAAARILLGIVLTSLVAPDAVVVFALDDFIERRSSDALFGRGCYRDPVASSRGHQVKCFGLRWLVASVCVLVPGAKQAWALPVLSVLCHPPKVKSRKAKGAAKQKKPAHRARRSRAGLRSRRLSTCARPRVGLGRHKTTIDVAAQVLSVVRHWLGARAMVAVLDGAFFSYKLLRHAVELRVVVVVRGQLRMVLYDEPEAQEAGRAGVGPTRGARQGTLKQKAEEAEAAWREREVAWYGGRQQRREVLTGVGMWTSNNQKAIKIRWVLTRPLATESAPGTRPTQRRIDVFVCTDPEATPEQVIAWYVQRWSEEVTFEESRRHLGIQTQRQWSRLAVTRTTPVLMGLMSVVTVLAVELSRGEVPKAQAAWYAKQDLTFSDCLACVRRQLWRARYCSAVRELTGGRDFSDEEFDALLDVLPLAA